MGLLSSLPRTSYMFFEPNILNIFQVIKLVYSLLYKIASLSHPAKPNAHAERIN